MAARKFVREGNGLAVGENPACRRGRGFTMMYWPRSMQLLHAVATFNSQLRHSPRKGILYVSRTRNAHGTENDKPEWMVKKPWWFSSSSPDDYAKTFVVESLESGEITVEEGIPNVYDLHHDGSFTIDQHDFRRVVIMKPTGGYHIAKDVVSVEEAESFATAYNASIAPGEPRAEVIDYVEAWRRARAQEYRDWKRENETDDLTIDPSTGQPVVRGRVEVYLANTTPRAGRGLNHRKSCAVGPVAKWSPAGALITEVFIVRKQFGDSSKDKDNLIEDKMLPAKADVTAKTTASESRLNRTVRRRPVGAPRRRPAPLSKLRRPGLSRQRSPAGTVRRSTVILIQSAKMATHEDINGRNQSLRKRQKTQISLSEVHQPADEQAG